MDFWEPSEFEKEEPVAKNSDQAEDEIPENVQAEPAFEADAARPTLDTSALCRHHRFERTDTDNAAGYCVSLQGADHETKNIPCQDYCDFLLLSEADVGIFAVSDGHGSVLRSDQGSFYAVSVMLDLVCSLADDPSMTPLDYVRYFQHKKGRKDILRRWMDKVDADLVYRNEASRCGKAEAYNEYGATLLFCLFAGDELLCGHIGDGGIVLITEDMSHVECVQIEDDRIEQTTLSLSHLDADFIHVMSYRRRDFRYVLMATDGISKGYDHAFHTDLPKLVIDSFLGDAMQTIDDFMLNRSQPQIGDDISLLFGSF